MFSISPERPEHAAAIASLLTEAFPPPAVKPIEQLRDGRPALSQLGRVALVTGSVAGSVRFWPAAVREYRSGRLENVLILGPLAVAPEFSGAGIGSALVQSGLAAAQAAGHAAVLLTGDAGYYQRFGFCSRLANGIALPGEGPERLLAFELVPGTLGRLTGTLVPARCHSPGTGRYSVISTFSVPMPSISASTRSPTSRNVFCGKPTPAGVPVSNRSPGKSVMIDESSAICSAIEKIICEVRESCLVSPLTANLSPRS